MLAEARKERQSDWGPMLSHSEGGAIPERFGRYEVSGVLGAGQCAGVYACHDSLLDRPVALKVLHKNLSDELRAQRLERFRVELRVFGRVVHPHVVSVYDACLEGEQPYLVMELCPGPSLAEWLARNGHMTPGQAARVFHQIALALEHIHSLGIVHRDLKPANLLFHHGTLKLADFGVAQADFVENGKSGVLLGTPAYMSPEQFAGDEITCRSDLFSAGAILFELLTGQAPLRGEPDSVLYERAYEQIPVVTDLSPDLWPDFDDFFDKALAKEADERFASAAEMCAALAEIVSEDELEEIGGIASPSGATVPLSHMFGYGQLPRRASSYLSRRPPREPPPSRVPSAARIHGAVPAPWVPRQKEDKPRQFKIMEFGSPQEEAPGCWERPGPKRRLDDFEYEERQKELPASPCDPKLDVDTDLGRGVGNSRSDEMSVGSDFAAGLKALGRRFVLPVSVGGGACVLFLLGLFVGGAGGTFSSDVSRGENRRLLDAPRDSDRDSVPLAGGDKQTPERGPIGAQFIRDSALTEGRGGKPVSFASFGANLGEGASSLASEQVLSADGKSSSLQIEVAAGQLKLPQGFRLALETNGQLYETASSTPTGEGRFRVNLVPVVSDGFGVD